MAGETVKIRKMPKKLLICKTRVNPLEFNKWQREKLNLKKNDVHSIEKIDKDSSIRKICKIQQKQKKLLEFMKWQTSPLYLKKWRQKTR